MWLLLGCAAPGPTAADVLAAADPALVALLDASPPSAWPDERGELDDVDLVEAQAAVEGTILTARIRGRGVAEGGGWLDLDLAGGPAPDLHLGAGDGWMRAAPMSGWARGPEVALAGEATVTGDEVRLRVDLGERVEAGHTGGAVAIVKGASGWDVGPAGRLGPPRDDARALLAALVAGGAPVAEDPDLTLAVAIAWGGLRALVEPDVLPVLERDAAARLAYGLTVDASLTERGAAWRLADAPPLAKVLWAWPAGEAAVYGPAPLAHAADRLSLADYRRLVPASLEPWRDLAPLRPGLAATAAAVDAAVAARLRYRADPALASLETQRALYAEEGAFVGDCVTATTVAVAMLQALGVPATGLGWVGGDSFHNLPLYLDGDRLRATQPGPAEEVYAYAFVPVLDPAVGLRVATESGWARGGAVVGGRTGDVARRLDEGVPWIDVARWTTEARAGGWPSLR